MDFTFQQDSVIQQPQSLFDSPLQPFNPIPLQPQHGPPLQREGGRGGSSSVVALHRMNRGIGTVKVAWEEWKVGIQGNPSIESLTLAHKKKWRMFPCPLERNTESKWYSRRKVLITAIEKRIEEKGISVIEAVEYFEDKRGSRSLDSIQKRLAKGETFN
jgi:hypothetical protein